MPMSRNKNNVQKNRTQKFTYAYNILVSTVQDIVNKFSDLSLKLQDKEYNN